MQISAASNLFPTVAPQASGGDQAALQQLQATQRQVQQLASRDREVRAHEQAHAAVGGVHAGAPVYQFTRGPNGVRYATSGHVSIDVGEVPGNPEATLDKMLQVARAALAPAQPSAQDRAVAAEATVKAQQARVQLAQQRQQPTDDSARSGGQNPAATELGRVGSVIDTSV